MNTIHIDTRPEYLSGQPSFSINKSTSLRECLIPLRCNLWVQLSALLLLTGAFSAVLFLIHELTVLLGTAFYTSFAAIILLMATFGGRDTYRAYSRVKHHIRTHGSFDKRLQKKFVEQMYCRRVGARAAAKDLGVAHELIPELARDWRII